MTLGKNLLAGLASSLWSALLGLAVVPLYLRYLGLEAYGLIGFFAMTQAMLQILDLGLAPTINREVARCSATGDLKQAGRLLHTLAIIYWCVAAVITLLVVALAPLISGYWLTSSHLPQATVTHAVMLMGLVVACRWPIGLYLGALMGAQRITTSSAVSIAMVTLGQLGAVAVLMWVSSTIEAFFLWQAGVGLVHALVMRWAAWRTVGRPDTRRFDREALKRVWRFSAGMGGVAVSALIFTQLDKVILSKMLSLADFGAYALATVVVNGLYVFINPLFSVVYPRFSALVASNSPEKLAELYCLSTRILGAMLFPIAMVLAVFAEELVRVWTGDAGIAARVAPVISLLAIGSALHGAMYLPYALQLAYGLTRLPLTINAILMVVQVPLMVYFALNYGALGGAMAWLVLHVLYLLLGTWMTHRRLLKWIGFKWLLQDVGLPLLVAAVVGMFAHYAIQRAEYAIYTKLLVAGALALLTSIICVALSPSLRALVLTRLRRKTKSTTPRLNLPDDTA